MRGLGETILQKLVASDEPLTVTRVAAFAVGVADGRRVSQPLDRLARAGLVEGKKRGKEPTLWTPTARGREVDQILDRITVDRGGTFMGTAQAGISFSESFALRR